MDAVSRKKAALPGAFSADVLAELRRTLEQARKEAGGDATVVRRLDFLALGLRWTAVEARAHALLAEGAKPGKGAGKQALDERRGLMREVFQKTPLALNAAYVSWGEDARFDRLGYRPGK